MECCFHCLHIQGYNDPHKFIATQGPLPSTLTHFWHLVWQEKCQVVVMLVNIVEGNKIKCEPYWPPSTDTGQQYGPFTVKLLNVETFANYIVRDIQLLVSLFVYR